MHKAKKLKGKLVIAIYYHPEAYPPTLNAINELAKVFEEIYVIYRPHLADCWAYPPNVKTVASGKRMSVNEQAELPILSKVFLFLQFSFLFFNSVIKHRPKMILVYDDFPLLSYHLFKKLLFFKHKIWYHNHDVSDNNVNRKYSIGWFAHNVEKVAFSYLDMFSIPAEARKMFFNFESFKGMYFFIPNYPSKAFYDKFFVRKKLSNPVKLIYQGSISPGHGIEEIMRVLSSNNGPRLNLTLIGNISNSYKNELKSLIGRLKIEDKVEICEAVNYGQLPGETIKCDIGVGINKPLNLIYTTGGTASNKIYEYAALGLPILYYDNDHYNEHLSKFKWAVKCALDDKSLLIAIEYIINNYNELSTQAREDFNNMLNFEKCFNLIVEYLSEKQY